ncbi:MULTISPECIES: hypothetical protein [Burkholderiaceae]|nr:MULTISPECIES: hypothetical protein [Burkholderiaceae]
MNLRPAPHSWREFTTDATHAVPRASDARVDVDVDVDVDVGQAG